MTSPRKNTYRYEDWKALSRKRGQPTDRLSLILKYDQTAKRDRISADKLLVGNKEIKINRHVKRI